MNKLIATLLATIILPLVSSSCNAQEGDSPKQFIAKWASSFNENDAKALLKFYDRSEDTELVMSAGIRKQGYSAIQDTYKSDFKAARFTDSKITKVSERKFGETALLTFDHQFKLKLKQDGSRWQVHIRTSTVLGRKNGQWKILLEHSSPINGIDRHVRIKDLLAPKSESE